MTQTMAAAFVRSGHFATFEQQKQVIALDSGSVYQ